MVRASAVLLLVAASAGACFFELPDVRDAPVDASTSLADAPSSDAPVGPEVDGSADALGDGTSPSCANGISLDAFLAGVVPQTQNGTTSFDGGDFVTKVTTTGAGVGHAFAGKDFAGAPKSISLAFDLELPAVNGVYAEPGCAIDLYHSANAQPVTNLFFEHATNGSFSFEISLAGDAGTAEPPPFFRGLGATSAVRRRVELVLEKMDVQRIEGQLVYDGATHPFSVAAALPITRYRVYCGITYASFSSAGTIVQTTGAVTGNVCP